MNTNPMVALMMPDSKVPTVTGIRWFFLTIGFFFTKQ